MGPEQRLVGQRPSLGQIIMAKRHGQRIGHVGRFGQLVEQQLSPDGLLHLKFWCATAAGEDLFYLSRGIMHHRHLCLGRRQADHSSSVTHQDGRLRPFIMRIELLDRHHVGPERSDDIGDATMNLLDAGCERIAQCAADHARLAEPEPGVGRNFYNAVAGRIESGINSENSHIDMPVAGSCRRSRLG